MERSSAKCKDKRTTHQPKHKKSGSRSLHRRAEFEHICAFLLYSITLILISLFPLQLSLSHLLDASTTLAIVHPRLSKQLSLLIRRQLHYNMLDILSSVG